MIKKITKIASAILLSSTLISSSVIAKENKNIKLHNNLDLSKNTYVVDYKEADVTGDKLIDQIYLVGIKENEEDIFAFDLNIIVKNGKTKKIIKTSSKDFGGYGGHLFIGDFTGDKVNDIMSTADTGGSGGIIENRIYTINNDEIKNIFNEEDNKGVNFQGKFVDGYKAELKSKKLNKEITLDISGNKKYYLEAKIYDKNGKLLKEVEPYTYPYVKIEAIQYEEGTYYLQGKQRIVGFVNPDTLSNVRSLWKYENSKWVPVEVEYGTFLDLSK